MVNKEKGAATGSAISMRRWIYSRWDCGTALSGNCACTSAQPLERVLVDPLLFVSTFSLPWTPPFPRGPMEVFFFTRRQPFIQLAAVASRHAEKLFYLVATREGEKFL